MPAPDDSSVARPGFTAGVSAVFSGFGTIARTPALWPWALVPLFILVALEAVFITLAIQVGGPWVRSLIPAFESDWGQIGAGILSWAAVAALAVVGWFVAVPLAPPLSAPALEHIVRRVENELGLPPRASIGFFHEVLCGFRALAGGLIVALPIFAILWIVRTRMRTPNGLLTGLFMICYAIFRIIVEYFREPDASMIGIFTRGQFFSFFVIALGIGFIVVAKRRPTYPKQSA